MDTCSFHEPWTTGSQGWSLSLVTQYDVKLVHEVEAAVGTTLQLYDVVEKEVMASMTQARPVCV